MLYFSKNYSMFAIVMMLSQTATINRYYYNNKINKTITINP